MKINRYLQNNKIKYYLQENSCQPSARNKGIEKSSGEFIAFLDADDYWDIEKLEKQIRVFNNQTVDVCYTDVKVLNSVTNQIMPYTRTRNHNQLRRGYILPYLIFYNFIPFAGVMVRKKCFEKIGKFDENIIMGDDWDILLRLAAYYHFDYVDEPLLIYRLGRPNQLSRKLDIRCEEQDKLINKFFINHKNLLKSSYIPKTTAFRARERGAEYAQIDFKKSFKYYCKAIKYEPLNYLNTKGLIKLFVLKAGLKANKKIK